MQLLVEAAAAAAIVMVVVAELTIDLLLKERKEEWGVGEEEISCGLAFAADTAITATSTGIDFKPSLLGQCS